MAAKKKEKTDDFSLFGDLEALMGLSLFGEEKETKAVKEDNEDTDEDSIEETKNVRRGRLVSPFNDAKPKGKKKPEKDESNDDDDDEYPDDDDE